MTEEEKNKGVPPEDETVDLFRENAEKVEAEGDAEYSADAEGSDTAEAKEPEQNGDSADAEKVTADDSAKEAGEAEVAKESEDSGKKKKNDKKKDPRDEKIAELSDRVLRQQAEFINYRNRTDKEKAQMFEVGAKSAFEKILPVIDNFERGLATLSEEEREQPFASGIDKTYKQLMNALAEAGVKPIEAVGQPFNPDLHNAVMHVEDESLGENVVVEEFQKGYLYHDTVLRHSMVKVAN
ncbi:MAG: nucleotide exchange factor GrpE [Lachnospiraceae bacterium]|nr:nucleotide exchange factor GrpE [Lachnospiraceae bacterium]